MLSSLTATEVAFLQIAVLQAAAALVWGLGAALVPAERAAMGHWATYAALSALTWTVLALNLQSPPLLGVLVGVCSAIALRRGIQLFTGQTSPWLGSVLLLLLVSAAGALGQGDSVRPLQAAVNFSVLAWLYLDTAMVLRHFARVRLQWRWPLLLTLPLLLGAIGFGSRALRALIWPDSVLTEMSTHSALNVGSALSYIVLVLLMHATLMALVVSRLVHDLKRLARRDSLTGLLNRRAIQELIDRHAGAQRRVDDTFSVLMIDIDHFKAVNDRHGHAAGDLALAHIARLMTQTLRSEDRLGRLGGEEFAVLLPAASLGRALAEAERLRLAVQLAPVNQADASVAMTVSIGVAESAGPAEDPARLLARADAALYRAKRLGRNRVEAASVESANALPQPAR